MVLLLVVCLACTGLIGCEKDTPRGKLIYYYLEQEPKNLDPQVSQDKASQTVIRNLFEGLVRQDADGKIVPGVAERWESTENDRVFTFYLRENAKWSDESELTAQDFLYGIRRALDPVTGSEICAPLFCIENAQAIRNGEAEMSSLGVRVLGKHTIQFTLTDSMKEFPARTLETVYLPCHREFFEKCAGRYGMEPDTVLGNGPFTLRKRYGWVHKEYLHLVKNSQYYAPEEVVPGGVKLKIAKFPQEPISDLLNVDIFLDAAPISREQIPAAEAKKMKVVGFEDTTWGLRINPEANPFTSLSMRQAVVQSLQPEAVAQVMLDGTEPTAGILPGAMEVDGTSYRERVGNPFRRYSDPEITHNLMKVGLKELKRSEMPQITILCADTLDAKRVANHLLTQWKQGMGEYFRIVTLSQAEIASRVAAGNYQLAIVKLESKTGDPAEALSQLLPKETEWILPQTGEERVREIFRMENEIIEQGWFYPLFGEKHYFVSAPNVEGIRFAPFSGGVIFRETGKWDVD